MKPFRIEIPDADLADLHARLNRTRWPDQLAGGWEVGIPVEAVRALAERWRSGYDWRSWEARVNDHPQVMAEVDGTTIHALHVRAPRDDALALILTHGWPGSVLEFLDVIGPLAEDFHLVIPAIPGFGFSGPVADDWDVPRVARAWMSLMGELGYARYGAQGGDWGSEISRELGRIDDACVGVHLNMLVHPPPDADAEPDERARYDADVRAFRKLSGYFQIQMRKPMTLAYGLHDSPVGQLAWIAEQFHNWAASPVDPDWLLTNVTLYWLTGTAGSSARLYHTSGRLPPQPSRTPTAVALFPDELRTPIRSVADRFDNIVRWTEMPRGGHFAALEEPALFVEDVRAFFGGLS